VNQRNHAILTSVSKVLCVYGFVVWLYVGVDIHLFPDTIAQKMGLATLFPLREDLAGQLAFSVSFVSAFVWDYLRRTEPLR
jgi:hypothetical protein